MGSQEPSSGVTYDEPLAVFENQEAPGTPLTTSEVADALDCARRTAYGKLETLADNGTLRTKKVGARGRVWWQPVRRAEALRSSSRPAIERAQFDELVQAVADYAIFVLDRDGYVQTWNAGAKQIKGYEEDEIRGEHFSTFYTETGRDSGRPEKNLAAAAEDGRIEDEGWRIRKDGSTFWANVTITALHGDDGELQGFVKITRDMTEHHEYEERLREEKERFETLVREVKDYAIFLLDSDGTVQTWNDGARELKGYEEDEILGEHFSAFYSEEDRAAGRPEGNLEAAAENGRVEDEGIRIRKDGSTFWANVTITALRDDDGEIRGYAKVTRDMTERHEYEERLRRQRDELDELNQISAVIRDIDQTLVAATTREEIEQAVCDRLAASETYAAAWTAEYTENYEEITPRARAGISDEYLDAIRSADAEVESNTEKGVGATALRTGTIQPMEDLDRGSSGEPWRESTLDEGYAAAISVPLVHNEVEYGVLTVYAVDESALDDRKIAVMRELGETISHALAAIRRKERERMLTALQESTRRLLQTDTPEEIGDIIVETLTQELSLSDALVYHFDTSENTLEPVSSSFQSDAYTNQLPPLTAGTDSPVWESFMNDEGMIDDSILPARGMNQRRSLAVPLGNHGVLTVAAAEQETFDTDTRNLVELVAATAEAAFDRVRSQMNLQERDELLQEQNQRLQRLNQINTIIREVDQGLVQATTREEVQNVVCDRLTASDRFRFAWIGVPYDVDGELAPRAWSGAGRGYLDSIDLATGTGTGGAPPAVRAADGGDVAVVPNVAENLREGRWRKEAFSREFQSVISVPLRHGDVSYGVLTVYADRPEVFGEMERAVFDELGETIANTINAIEARHSLLRDRTIELELTLQDESACFLARFARDCGAEVTFEGLIPLTENRARVFYVVRGATADDVSSSLDRSLAVESYQKIASSDDGLLMESVVSGQALALSLLNQGASLRSLTVNEDEMRLLVELPSDTDVRKFVEQFQSRYDHAEFIARRERERSVSTADGFYAALEDSLTDRQLEVLTTAYHGGFFDSPRRSTGADIAALLDVSQPTVTEQLRKAQSKILDLLLDERRVTA